MASRREMQALITLSGRISPSLQNALRQTQRGIGGVTASSKLLNKGFALAAKGIAVGTAAAGAGIAYLAKKGLGLASDLTEVQNVVDVTFGKNSPINAWSQTALKQFGLSELAAKKYSGTMGAMLKSSGLSSKSLVTMSENLTGLTGDFSSFYNIEQEDAFTKIRAGISGETEPLKQLGINMSVANLEAYALSQGIKTSYQKMNQASQMTLRYNYLLKASKDAQGDFNRTQAGYANQSRLLKTNIQQLSAKLMGAALPAFTKLTNMGNKLLNGAIGNPEFIKKFQDIIQNISDKIVEIIPKVMSWFQSLGPKIKEVYDIVVKVGNFVKNNWALIEPVIWGIVAAQLAMNIAAKGALIFSAISKAIEFARAAMIFYRDGAALSTIAQWAFNAALSANPIGVVIVAIGALVAAGVFLYKNWDTITEKASGLWKGIKNAFGTGVNWIIDKVNWLIGKLNKIPGVDIGLIEHVQTGTVGASAVKANGMEKYASGGLANKASIFGEAGPEMAIPIKYKNARSLSLLNQTAKAIGADKSKGSGYPQFIYSPVVSGNIDNATKKVLDDDKENFFNMADRWWRQRLGEVL
jgi:hypothetical protein